MKDQNLWTPEPQCKLKGNRTMSSQFWREIIFSLAPPNHWKWLDIYLPCIFSWRVTDIFQQILKVSHNHLPVPPTLRPSVCLPISCTWPLKPNVFRINFSQPASPASRSVLWREHSGQWGEYLLCRICQFPWCKCTHGRQLQATDVTSFNAVLNCLSRGCLLSSSTAPLKSLIPCLPNQEALEKMRSPGSLLRTTAWMRPELGTLDWYFQHF